MAITLKNREDLIKVSKDISEKAIIVSVSVAKTISNLCDKYVENMSTRAKSTKVNATAKSTPKTTAKKTKAVKVS